MGKTIGRFGYEIIKMTESDRMPFDPFVKIWLERKFTHADDVQSVSPQLNSKEKIDSHIRLLKEDLDSVGRKAKVALKTAKSSTLKIVESRK